MPLPEPGSPEEVAQDVDFIAAVIEEKEKSNTLGIPPKDISVCFEMADICTGEALLESRGSSGR